MRQLLLALVGAAIFVGALILGWNFGAANTAPVDVDLLVVQLSGFTVWQLVVSSFALGAIVVSLASGFFGLRGWVLKRRYRAAIRRLESEIHQLRSLPLSADDAAVAENAPAAGKALAAERKSLPLARGQG